MHDSPMRATAGKLSALLLAILIPLTGPPARAAGPYMVKDINPTAAPASSNPHDFAALGSIAFFYAGDGSQGLSLWRSDGSDEGTYALTKVCYSGCANVPVWFALTDSFYFFLTLSPAAGTPQLWVSAGTADTTRRLADVAPVPFKGGLSVPEQGLLYFVAAASPFGYRLWRSDGTPAGTFALADVSPDLDQQRTRGMVDFNGRLYFAANDGHGPELWTSDGTAAGTAVVANLAPGTPEGTPKFLAVVAGRLVFVADTPGRGAELWRSDGTPAGTVPLRELVRGPGSPTFYDFFSVGDRALFVADDGRSGQQLWSTDGTNRGTRRLTSFPGALPFGTLGEFFAQLGHRVFILADDGVHGAEPWVSDGTAGGTQLAADLCPGPCSSSPGVSRTIGDRVYLVAGDGSPTRFLWATDGTAGGTVKIKAVCSAAGCANFVPWILGPVGNRVLFLAADARGAVQIWRTDGGAGDAVRLTRFPTNFLAGLRGGLALPAVPIPGLLLYAGEDPVHGVELWRSNGLRSGTRLLRDIAPADLGGSFPTALVAAGSKLFFIATDGMHGRQLWKSDGSAAGTAAASDLPATSAPFFSPRQTAAIGETLFFPVFGAGSLTLWKSDGTPAGALRLTPDGTRLNPSFVPAAAGGKVFFDADDGVHGFALWESDGTPAGTAPVDPAGWSGGGAAPLVAFQGRLFYVAASPATGLQELWRTDGTDRLRIAALNTFPTEPFPRPLQEYRGRLYFFAQDDGNLGSRSRLWSTDGTPAGTQVVAPVGSSPGQSFSGATLATAGDSLFVFGSLVDDGGGGQSGLFVSDGTAAGTRFVAPVSATQDLFHPLPPLDFNGRLAFVGPAPQGAPPLADGSVWLSDGTPAGTVPLRDGTGQSMTSPFYLGIHAGRLAVTRPSPSTGLLDVWESDGTPAGTRLVWSPGLTVDRLSAAGKAAVAGSLLFAAAYDPVHGTELWALPPAP